MTLAEATRRFVRDVVLPSEPPPGHHLAADTRRRLQDAAKEYGVFAPHVGAEFGGRGLGIQDWPAVFQEAGYSPFGPVALNCMAPDEGNMRLLELVATTDQQERYLRPLAEGRIRSCFAMTEPHPGAGSDPAALMTTATRTDGGWRIDGTKRFISGAAGAAFAIVMARDDRSGNATMLLVDTDNPGFRIGARVAAIDRAIDGGHPYVHFEDCVVADNAVLGAVGEGFRYAQVRLGPARLTHCMRWLGLARRALDIALDRVERRSLFGSAMKDLGLAQELIARCIIDIETSDAIIAKTARVMADDPRAGAALSSVAKVHCSEAVFAVIDRAMQLCGGDGMTDALPLASFLNEVRPFRVYDGSTETHKWAIARRATRTRTKEIESGLERRMDAVNDHA
ncbi:acyl-CoA dehydrogenase family protein [Phytohabitans suffuscus]|uniref:Acyl-CoA dehydrogenase n=1 Tax=Phytohabitans suffuscus TaxID=624315 RepID=A0A6F8YCK5_9ACTN|nr:acyl-CoA dehydrogenase family protein [Phytohabitans suffuscus]BCB83763.1 acyl-CoA dehydrogenase [Phytohabitans suffuscus]